MKIHKSTQTLRMCLIHPVLLPGCAFCRLKFWKVHLTHSHDGRGLDFIKSAREPPGSGQDVSIKLYPYPSLSPIINIYSRGKWKHNTGPSLNCTWSQNEMKFHCHFFAWSCLDVCDLFLFSDQSVHFNSHLWLYDISDYINFPEFWESLQKHNYFWGISVQK